MNLVCVPSDDVLNEILSITCLLCCTCKCFGVRGCGGKGVVPKEPLRYPAEYYVPPPTRSRCFCPRCHFSV